MDSVRLLLRLVLIHLEFVESSSYISKQNGWIALPRDIERYWIWADARRFKMWIHLVFSAKWEDSMTIIGNTQVKLKRGQVAVSTRELMRQWGCCCEMATAFLRNLETSGMITREINKQYSIISIVDYDMYQPSSGAQSSPIAKPKIQHKAVREAVQNKEINKEEKKIKSSILFSFENEQKFYNEVKENDNTINSLCVVLNIQASEVQKKLHVFLTDIRLREKGHKDTADFINHFRYWCEKKLKSVNAPTDKISNDSNNQQQSARRGTEISNKPNKDYKTDAF
jgi:hypothetical protein